jgi:hypothetical protein
MVCGDSRTWTVAGHYNTNKNAAAAVAAAAAAAADDDDDNNNNNNNNNNNLYVVFHYVNRIIYRWPEHAADTVVSCWARRFAYDAARYDTIILGRWRLLMRHSIIYHLFRMNESRVNDNSLFFNL